jgi:membrane associated rhomboid family serine protease
LRLFEVSTPDIFGIFALPASFIGFIHQPWSLFTYMFMHAGILQIYRIYRGNLLQTVARKR